MTQAQMSHEPQAATVGREPPRLLFTLLNPVIRVVLQSPLHGLVSKRLLIINVIGRKTGKHYAVPIGYTQIGRTIYFGTKGSWYKNLLAGQPTKLRLRGHDVVATIDVIRDETKLRASYRVFLAQAPHFAQILGVRLDAQGEPFPADLARVQQEGHIVGKIQLP